MTNAQMHEQFTKEINEAEGVSHSDMRNWLTVSASRYLQLASTAKRFAVSCEMIGDAKDAAMFQTASVSARARADTLCRVFVKMFPGG